MSKKTNKPRCKFCGSTQIRYRVKTEDFVCHTCGRTFSDIDGSDPSDPGTATQL